MHILNFTLRSKNSLSVMNDLEMTQQLLIKAGRESLCTRGIIN